ncbi:MAG: hypothetical protein U0794_09235 [Isosphaeraceae bacterium]
MALRVLLVGLVAGLGLSLPTGRQIATWRDSANAWVTARLAAWDAQMPAGDDAFVFVTDSAPTDIDAASVAPALVAAETPLPETPAITETPATSPTQASSGAVVASTSENRPAESATICDLGREMAEDLAVPTEPTAFDDTELMPEPAPTPEPQPEPAPTPILATPAVALDASFDAAMMDVVASFTADLSRPTPTTEPAPLLAEAAPAAPVAPVPAYEPIAIDESFATDLACVLNRASEGLDIRRPAPARDELIRVEDDLANDVAYALNREAEGLTVFPKTIVSETKPTPEPTSELAAPSNRLSHAVRLTREAVFAWAKVLHAPAVVTISH